MKNFFIEQIALCPVDPVRAKELLQAIGLTDWIDDHVVARGFVKGIGEGVNEADLRFNYQATRPDAKPLEVEILHYTDGPNWMQRHAPSVSHLGMHVTAQELAEIRTKMDDLNVRVAQEVFTESHTNAFLIETGRKYQYVIFDTRAILGVDLKFIVRRERPDAAE